MKVRYLSGWCAGGRHGRCAHVVQAATERRPELTCSCRCHTMTRRFGWRYTR